MDTPRRVKTTGKTYNKIERQPYPPPVSVETVQGLIPPYGVEETLVVNGRA